MREIKFRVWDKILKGWSLNTQYWRHLRTEKMLFVTPEQGERYIFEQFTGLLDKNGVEIYEGDIVKGIVFTPSCLDKKYFFVGAVCWDCEDAGFFYESMSDKWPYIKSWYANNAEVIGNIHENPELLEKK